MKCSDLYLEINSYTKSKYLCISMTNMFESWAKTSVVKDQTYWMCQNCLLYQACERLLQYRVDQKFKTNKVKPVANRLHVAMPKKRDEKERPVCIPEKVSGEFYTISSVTLLRHPHRKFAYIFHFWSHFMRI